MSEPNRILLIEDNPGDALLVQLMLEEAGDPEFRLTHVGRIADALEPVKSGSIDCALVDLSLPDADGLEGVERLREFAPEVPMIVLTGRDDLDLAIAAMQNGAQDYLIKGKVDSGLLMRAVRYAVERKRAEVALAFQALHDQLTGLPNRALFIDRLNQALASRGRRQTTVAVLFLDLDRLKVVNDSLGHGAGDQVIVEVARRVAAVLRPGDTVARFGGDEFLVLCQDLSGPDECISIAKRLFETVREPIDVAGAQIVLTASLGIAVAGEPYETGDALIRSADAAMYRAKEAGGDRWRVFDQEIHHRAVTRLETEVALRHALDVPEFTVLYQPIIRAADGTLAGYEALVRWWHPSQGLVLPAAFIPLAEETGLIERIGAWVLTEACYDAGRWPAHFDSLRDPFLSVNVSPRQLTCPSLVATVEAALERSGWPAAALWLEITEGAIMADLGASVRSLHALHDLGVKIAVDDFGTGYTSLSNLKRFPVDVIKIDRSFVVGLGPDRGDTAITTAVIQLAHTLGIAATAEGVETEDQYSLLQQLGCDYLQGYFVGRPASTAVAQATAVAGSQ